jgi:serine/threonine-protein kinase
MALRKEPQRRYASVGQLSEDVRRFLQGRAVIAHKDTFGYRASKFIRRNTIATAAAALVLLTLLGGIVATAWQAQRATRQARIADEQARVASAARDQAQREGAKAQSINAFLQNILGFSDPTWVQANARGNAHQTTIADAIDEAARRAEAELAGEPEVLASVQFSIGRILEQRGQLDRAEALLRSSLDLRRKVLGSEHSETAQSMAALGERLTNSGKSAEADPLLREAVAFFRQTEQKSYADLKWFAISLNVLGQAQVARGEAAAGEQFLLESLEVSQNLSGSDRALISIVFNNLGLVRGEQGDVDGAIAYLEKSLEELRRAPGDLRMYRATTLVNFGFWSVLKGDYAQAEPVLSEAIDLFRTTVGEESQKTIFARIHLANLYCERGDYSQSRETIDQVLGIQQRVLSEGHIDFARSWIVLGKILTQTGDAATGETFLRRALELRNRAFAQGHWRIAEVQKALGDCVAQQERYDEAEQLLVASHTALDKKLGARDPRTLNARRSLVRFYETIGKPESAAAYR